jgi:hypothetical protein
MQIEADSAFISTLPGAGKAPFRRFTPPSPVPGAGKDTGGLFTSLAPGTGERDKRVRGLQPSAFSPELINIRYIHIYCMRMGRGKIYMLCKDKDIGNSIPINQSL